MTTYRLEIEQTLSLTVEVEANTEEEARETAIELVTSTQGRYDPNTTYNSDEIEVTYIEEKS